MPDTPSATPFLALRIAAKRMETPDICVLELVRPDGGALPGFEAGAHVTVETPSGKRRTYSLCNDPAERHRYVLGVKVERGGRGGSLSVGTHTEVGRDLSVSAPVNRFPLLPAPEYLFLAGGIGITPILSMVRQLARTEQAPFRLIYCTRDAERTAFRGELGAPPFQRHTTIHHDAGDPARAFDFWPLLERPGRGHVYCCGPRALMEEVRGMSGHWPPASIHFEDFASDVLPVRTEDTAFTVRHARSGASIAIPADATILDTLRRHGHRLPSSCEGGICGACRTVLVAGEPDHRDQVLSEAERRRYIQICVSRARSAELVLDW